MSETATQTAPEQPATALRSIREIVADLSKPIAQKHLKSKKQGGNTITFIPWYNAVKYLDHFAPGWSYSVKSIEHIKEQVVLVVEIAIPCAEGVVTRQATGNENDVTSSYGDPFSNAESMALRRAAAKYGLGLHLYDK
jgi:hypothetical protein